MKQRSAPLESVPRLPEGSEPIAHGSARFYMPEEKSHIQSKLKLLKRDVDKLGHSISNHSIASGTDPQLQHPGETPLSDLLNYDSNLRNQFSNQNSSVSHPLLSTTSSQQYLHGSAPETPHLNGQRRAPRSRQVPKRLRVDISQPNEQVVHVRRGSLSSSPQVTPLLPRRHIKSPSVLTSEPLPDDPHTYPYMETDTNIQTQPFSMSGTLTGQTGSSSLQRFMKSNPGKRRQSSYSRHEEDKTQGSNFIYSSNAGSYNTGQFASTREGKLNNTTSTDTADWTAEEARARRHQQNSFQPSESSTILRIEEAHASQEQTERVEPARKDQAIKLHSLTGNQGQFTQQSSFSFINEQKIKVPQNSIQSENMANTLERLVHTPVIEGLSSILQTDGHPHDFNSGMKQLQELKDRLDREKKAEAIDRVISSGYRANSALFTKVAGDVGLFDMQDEPHQHNFDSSVLESGNSQAETGAEGPLSHNHRNLRYEDQGKEEAHSLMTANRISTSSLIPNTIDHRRESKQAKSIPRINELQNARRTSISRSQANFTPPLYPQKPIYSQESAHQRKNSGAFEALDCSPSLLLSQSPDQSYISASQIHMNYNNAKYYMFDTRRPSEIEEDRVLVSSTALPQQERRPCELEPHPADTLKTEEGKEDKSAKQFISDRLSTSQMSRRNQSGGGQAKPAERDHNLLEQRVQELELSLRQKDRILRDKEDEIARVNSECQKLQRQLKHSKTELEESRNFQKQKDEHIQRVESELRKRTNELQERGAQIERSIIQISTLTKDNQDLREYLEKLIKKADRNKRHISTPLSPSLKSTNLQLIHSSHTGRRLPRSYSQEQYGRQHRPLTPHSHYKAKSPSALSYQENETSKERREIELRSEKDAAHNAMLVDDLKRLLSVQHRNEVFKKVKQLLSVNKSTSKSISLFQRLKKLMNDCYNDEPPMSGHLPGTRTATFYKEDEEYRNRSSHKYSRSHHKRTGTIAREFSHKDVWRWIRKIMTEYSSLKTEEAENKGVRRDYWKDQIELLVEITRCPDYKFLISTVEKLNEEHLRMSAIMRKIKEMIRLRKSESNLSDNCEVKRSRGRPQKLLKYYIEFVNNCFRDGI